MRAHYKHLTRTDRLRIEECTRHKIPVKDIAEELGVHYTTIYRELKRGKYQHKIAYIDYCEKKYRFETRYSADIAEEKYRYNLQAKGAPLKIGNDFSLANYLENKIVNDGYSPAAALGDIKNKGLRFKTSISINTLYSYIEKGVFARLDLQHFPNKIKQKREKREIVIKCAPRGTSIEKRPKEILNRNEFGHWEMDCVCGSSNAVFLVLTERMTRKEIIMSMVNQKAQSVVHCLNILEYKYGKLFKKVFKTITVDNGSEFSSYDEMERSIYGRGKNKRTKIYYCHPYSSCERGGNERMNREIRRKVPKGCDLSKFTQSEVKEIERWLNNYPRKMFSYGTSQQRFDEEMAKLV